MKKIFLDLDGTLAKFNVRNALQRFDKEVGFLTIAVGAGLKLEDGRLKIDENYIKSLING